MDSTTLLLYTQVVLYFVFMIIIGLITQRWVSTMAGFFSSDRELGVIAMGLGLASIIFSGAMLPAITGFAITHSLWIASLYMWGWAAGIIVFGKVFAPAVRRSGVFTLAEWAEVRFDSNTRTVVAVAISIAAFGALFSQVIGLGNILTALTDIPYWAATLGIVLLCTFYMYAGGFWALSISDMSHITLVIIAFMGALTYLFSTVANPIEILTNSPAVEIRVDTFLGISPGDFLTSLKFPSLASFLFGWFITQMGCQYYWMRAVGGRSERAVKKGYYLSGIIAIIFGSTVLALFGLYALYIFGEDNFKPDIAFSLIIKSLPIGLDGLLLLALMAACMSTFSTALLGVASPITRDIYQRLFAPNASTVQLTKASRTITVVVALIAYLFALLWKAGAAHGLAFMWAFSSPTAATLLLGYFWKRVTVKAAFWGELIGLILTTVWYISGLSDVVHPMWVGFITTFIMIMMITLVTKPKYYASKEFKPGALSTASGLAQTNMTLSKQCQGERFREAMCNVMRPCIGSKKYRDRMEQRHNNTYTLADFMFPHITGRRFNEEEMVSPPKDLTHRSNGNRILNWREKKILNFIREGRNTLVDFSDNLGITAPIANNIAEQLEQDGYIVRVEYKGINRFNWLLTDMGAAELDPLNADEIRLLNEGGINMSQYKILTYVKTHPKVIAGEICEKMKLNKNEMISDLCYLIGRKLLTESGIIRRKVTITEKGIETMELLENLIKM